MGKLLFAVIAVSVCFGITRGFAGSDEGLRLTEPSSNQVQDASQFNVQPALKAEQADLNYPITIRCVSDVDGEKMNCENL